MNQINLKKDNCSQLKKNTEVLSQSDILKLYQAISSQWIFIENYTKLLLEINFESNMSDPLALATEIGNIADRQSHHPEILISYGLIKITLWSHSVNRLTLNDFILCSKIDEIVVNFKIK